MIVGVGADIARVSRIERAMRRHGRRFAERILDPAERLECRDDPQAARFLARRFAAKEAAAKAFGVGIGAELGWRDIAVAHHDGGRPALAFSTGAEALRRRLGVGAAHLSLADDGDYALAFVVLVAAPV